MATSLSQNPSPLVCFHISEHRRGFAVDLRVVWVKDVNFFSHGSDCVADYTEFPSSAFGGCLVWGWLGMPQTLPCAEPWAWWLHAAACTNPWRQGLLGLIPEFIPGQPCTFAEVSCSFSLCSMKRSAFCAALVLACWCTREGVQGGVGLPGLACAKCVTQHALTQHPWLSQ